MLVGYLTQANSAPEQMIRFARKKAIIVALSGALLVPTTAVRATPCSAGGTTALSQGEIAIEVRRLQTTLMVAALSCNARSYYNDFVIRHRPRLQHYGKAIRLEFRRRYGRNAPTELNRFITHLANQASAQSNADRDAFCSEAMMLFQQAETRGKMLVGIVLGPTSTARAASAACDETMATSFHPRANGTAAPSP